MECKICFQKFSPNLPELTPRILTSCGHTICEKCAENLLKNYKKLKCPFDRIVTYVSEDSDDSNMDCQICLQKYNGNSKNRIPRILKKCGHTMCHQCLKKQEEDDQIVCPFDRKVTRLRAEQ
ncbi:Protein CBG18425 [Caenorhabditis briggsae]|uniref:Protein CBG18425 n=1 Tax=Caenorhabditis briggsae TaxID=6238 RepID=A8XTA5_CAEBR|nr:Protein CBG18425 [Caenorhabditis briggsae]CAP35882.2 Protein CBG18425 [Caenorhabditis briggsae]